MSIVKLFVKSSNSSSERRLNLDDTIGQIKSRLEPVVGIPVGDQILALYNGKQLIAKLEDDTQLLGLFQPQDYYILSVDNRNPNAPNAIDFNDLSAVEKYEMSDADYNKLGDSVLAFKKRNQIGRFSKEAEKKKSELNDPEAFSEEASKIKVGDRCEVDVHESGVMKRRGTVKYVGKTNFRPGYWVGIHYDEPFGKNDGSAEGVRYFTCPNNHGSFVRPNKVIVGDFPEEDLLGDDDDDLEEM
ncbi:hypothetical protein H4219_001171 [Mycoemilia scoparia]|uniref:CAP-Gly domain-containing protein n=1 Tax=Mycoemilia scoparia TaxID=417184 RepID=A0A9W8A0T4_9FUNG|nr:hypothetical protein H4219_001171 [Mycoemilia scoparia]